MRLRKSTNFWRNRNDRTAYLLLSPSLLVLGLVILYPLLNTLWLSIQHQILTRPYQDHFVGTTHYLQALTDPEVRTMAWHTLIFTVCSVGAKMGFGLLGALLLNVQMRGVTWVRSFYMLPWLVPSVVAAMVWRWIFNDPFGIANELLHRLGLAHVQWLSHDITAMGCVILVDVWRGLPLMTLLLLAGLQSIPHETIEAAMIDGASVWQRFWRVTLPQMRSVLLMTGTLSLIGTFNSFNIIYVMTGGGPAHATDILVTYVFRLAFTAFDFGYAAALSILIIVVILMLTLLYERLLTRKEEART